MEPAYRHTQAGVPLILGLGLAGCWFLAAAARNDGHVGLLAAAGLMFGLAWLFGTLRVEVDATHLRLRYGPGLVRKTWNVRDVADVAVVRNRWWWGWGIRLTPEGWLYNVHGLDAVAVTLRSGKRFRVGTDEPERLRQAIAMHLGPS